MPATGDFARLRQLERDMRDLAAPDGSAQRLINSYAAKEVHGVLVEEFSSGEGAYGSWKRTAAGKQALDSAQIPKTFFVIVVPGGIFGFSSIPWIIAQQEGATFKERVIEANKQFLNFNSKGRLVAQRRIFKKSIGPAPAGEQFGELRRGAYQRFATGHTVGARILPPRPITPDDRGIPSKYGDACNRGCEAAMAKWYAKAGG